MNRQLALCLLLAAQGVSSLSVSAGAPLTLLGGFLGSGKTTTLEHLLTNRDGLKIAVVVNDVAAVNVDAMKMRRASVTEADGIDMIQLENGCVCCSASGDLAPAVKSLIERAESPFDHVVIELSGVADPRKVQNSLNLGGLAVDRKVTVVDSNLFPELYGTIDKAGERSDLAGAQAKDDKCLVDRPVVDLLLQQVETADLILANKVDIATEQELRTTLSACRALNAGADIVSTTFGDADLEDVLPRERSAAAAATAAAAAVPAKPTGGVFFTAPKVGKKKAAGAGCAPSVDFVTHVYSARRPFKQQRLIELLGRWPLPMTVLDLDQLAEEQAKMQAEPVPGKDATFAGVLRSKGTTWLDVDPTTSVEWSHAGRQFWLKRGPVWWATLPEQVMRKCFTAEAFEAERATFEGEDGDRRQEIVFIGTNLDVAGISSALDACLCTDAEMAEYRAAAAQEEARLARGREGPFRFDIGTRVECNAETWVAGEVVAHYYREPDWPPERWMPYQIKLDTGMLIFAPSDVSGCIRAESSSWLPKVPKLFS